VHLLRVRGDLRPDLGAIHVTVAETTATGLRLISAGAGSGKTHQLTRVVMEAVDPRGTAPVAIDGLVAVTYTRKAAAELQARVRQTLIAAGANGPARSLGLAQLGTVHAVCLRWLRELAIDAGLSPMLDVLPGGEAGTLRQALEHGLPAELCSRLDRLAEALDVRWDARVKRWDWLEPVQQVMTLARSNRIAPGALHVMAERSSERLRSLLGAPEPDGDIIEAELAQTLDEAITSLIPLDTGQKNTREARRTLERARRRLGAGGLRWSEWIALQKIDGGKAARAALASVASVARRVDHHPRLHAELHRFILAIYEGASLGLEAYDEWKRERRLVDFVDMVDRALALIHVHEVRAELEQRLGLCVVDEFQDTSPVQLALFMELHAMCGRSTWVGDPKQCIFEYAGADPDLMDAVTDWIERAGGGSETLLENRRSRPELVVACSRLFAAAFTPHGYRPDQVAMSPWRRDVPELAGLPAFGVWWLEGQNRDQALDAMAEGVARLLGDPGATLVSDRASGRARALQAGDVAVLVATNAEAEQVTAALARRGLRAAVARAGLLDTPEGTLVEAALSYVADRGDTRSLAIIDALTGFGEQTPDRWLEAQITRHAQYAEARDKGVPFTPAEPSRLARELDGIRHDLPVLSPSEAVDCVLARLNVAALCARWPNFDQRLSNLEALRTLAARYETRCRHQREAASIAGLLRFFADARQKVLLQDEERATDDQHSSQGPDTVSVTTYHRAKGLEWPIVVLGSLDREERRDAFEVLPESSREPFDPINPLAGRWIRYFPWPFGQHRSAPLADTVASAREGREVQRREARERVRLLYVGFTRARDHLILTARPGRQGPKTAWLDELRDASGAPLLSLPAPNPGASGTNLGIRGTDGVTALFPARVCALQPGSDAPCSPPVPSAPRWFAPPAESCLPRLRYDIAPSRAEHDWPELELGNAGDIVSFGPRLPLGSERPEDWSRVGDTLHAFLAADVYTQPTRQRLDCAERLLRASELLALIQPDALVLASDRLQTWVAATWPDATWHRELPVSGAIDTPQGTRRIAGVLDLLLELRNGVVLIDYKSYPGRRDTWKDKAREHAPQLAAYTRVLQMAGRDVLSQWLCFPVPGGAIRVNQPRRADQAAPAGA
jgi:ATP-dependent helicase/nuclease subunit A